MRRSLPLLHVRRSNTYGTPASQFLRAFSTAALYGAALCVSAASAQTGPAGTIAIGLSDGTLVPATGRDTVVLAAEADRIGGINSPARDDTPIITADGRLMFFNSTRFGERPWAREQAGRYDDDIYVAHAVKPGGDEWRQPENLRAVNTSDDDGIVAISSSGHQLYYLSLRRGWQKNGGPFYFARRSGATVAAMTGLGGGITQFFSSVPVKGRIRIFGASISADALSFYFATTAYSHTSDHEIWVSRRPSIESEWSMPENLGPFVNAGGGSYAPFIAADGRTLYFSSGRDGGLGGDDIYMTVLKDGQWRQAINVGAPINSAADDAFLSLPASGDRVYFSSTRSGDGDLFVAPMRAEFRPGNVALLTTSILDSISGAPIEATVTIEDVATGTTVYSATTSAADGHAASVLRPGGRYIVSISAPGYVFQSETVTLPNDSTFAEMHRTFRLRHPDANRAIRLNNIVFDYRSATLRPESSAELNRLVAFLTESPEIRIAVHGHTDSMGTAAFNERLSFDRAAAVRTFLIEKGGIDSSRIESAGFGFARPIVPNDREEQREINRRVEFVILEPTDDVTP